MKTYQWIVSTVHCPNCDDTNHGVRVIVAVENEETHHVSYGVLCTNCHVLSVSDDPSEDFWRMMGQIPPTDTGN